MEKGPRVSGGRSLADLERALAEERKKLSSKVKKGKK